MSTNQIPYKIYLEEDEMPKAWYNVRADMVNKPAPLLNPETGKPMTLGKLLVCLDIFADVELIRIQRLHKNLTIELLPCQQKADLNTSKTMQILMAAKE